MTDSQHPGEGGQSETAHDVNSSALHAQLSSSQGGKDVQGGQLSSP